MFLATRISCSYWGSHCMGFISSWQRNDLGSNFIVLCIAAETEMLLGSECRPPPSPIDFHAWMCCQNEACVHTSKSSWHSLKIMTHIALDFTGQRYSSDSKTWCSTSSCCLQLYQDSRKSLPPLWENRWNVLFFYVVPSGMGRKLSSQAPGVVSVGIWSVVDSSRRSGKAQKRSRGY